MDWAIFHASIWSACQRDQIGNTLTRNAKECLMRELNQAQDRNYLHLSCGNVYYVTKISSHQALGAFLARVQK
jgi:hypothetical protein